MQLTLLNNSPPYRPKGISCILIWISIFTFSTSLYAQDSASNKIHVGYNLELAYHSMNFSSINASGVMFGTPANNQPFLSIYFTVGKPDKLYASIYGQFDLGGTTASGSFNGYNNINAYATQTKYGADAYYSLLNKKKYGLYIMGGLSFTKLNIYSTTKNGMPVGDTISVFENAVVKENLMFRTGFLFEFWRGHGKGLRTSFALKAGYDFELIQPSGYTWYDYPGGNTKLLVPGPNINFGGLYTGLSLNFWLEKWQKANAASYTKSEAPVIPDSTKNFKKGLGLFVGGGITTANFDALRSQNSWFLNQPPDIIPIIAFDINFGDPRKVIFTLPVSIGYSSSSSSTINNGNYNMSSYWASFGLLAGHEIYSNESNKIVKGITLSVGIKYAEDGLPTKGGFDLTVDQTMLNAELRIDLFKFYSKSVSVQSDKYSLHSFTAYTISLKAGYDLPITQPQWVNGTNVVLPPSTTLGGFYAGIGLGMAIYYKK